MKKLLALVLFPGICNAYSLYQQGTQQLDVNGYVGYQIVGMTAPDKNHGSRPELGFSLSYKYDDNWSAYVQMAHSEHLQNALTYAFVSYDKKLSDNLQIGFKGGKLRHQFALYNDIRVNPMTRPSIIMPQAIYWDSLQYFLTSGDGFNFNIKWKNLELGYTIDYPEVADPKGEAKVWSGAIHKSIPTHFGSHQLATLKYKFDEIPLIYKMSWSYVNLGNDKTDFANTSFPQYKNKDAINEILTAGFILDLHPLTLSAEVLTFKPFFSSWKGINTFSYGDSFTAKYEVTDNISVYSNYNYYFSNLAHQKSWYSNTTDVSIGTNYHRDNWQIGLEVHHINGGRWVDPNNWQVNNNAYKDWWMIGTNFILSF